VNLYGEKSSSSKEAEEENSSLNDLFKALLRLTSTGDKKSPGYYSLLNKASSAMIHKIAQLSMEKYKPDLVINIPCDSAKTFDFYKAKELIELGKREAKNAMRIYRNPGIIE
jgi:NTE family protein